ncbi:hypothetical protein F4561_005037 [Lipingzhangella halophila]|uniref:Uncharacterized protein n=1 Tax=Lipingzhangella halophila TaxID=1783352 RepID=A0A7W7RLJ8_9ACTN|nr:hypothetical protein [Lipingzhangella halophila]MBB4934217.1 hypothetical protein [Lipingzhangella halophila]
MDRGIDARLRFNTRFHDQVALAEIELYSELLTAVATAEHHLSLAEIDRILGVRPARAGSTGHSAAPRPTSVPSPSRHTAASERKRSAKRG